MDELPLFRIRIFIECSFSSVTRHARRGDRSTASDIGPRDDHPSRRAPEERSDAEPGETGNKNTRRQPKHPDRPVRI